MFVTVTDRSENILLLPLGWQFPLWSSLRGLHGLWCSPHHHLRRNLHVSRQREEPQGKGTQIEPFQAAQYIRLPTLWFPHEPFHLKCLKNYFKKKTQHNRNQTFYESTEQLASYTWHMCKPNPFLMHFFIKLFCVLFVNCCELGSGSI